MFEPTGAAASALRWIELGRDVLVRGDDGSGRTTALDTLVTSATEAGIHVLTVRAFRAPSTPALAPFLVHGLVQERPGARPSIGAIAQSLAEELQGPRNLLAVDDIDLLDDWSLLVVEELLRRTSARLAATLAGTTLDHTSAPVLRVLAHRAPAEVRVGALGLWDMASLIEHRLGGQPDLNLVAGVLARSGGHAGVALALTDAGRWSGSIESTGGMWRETSPLDDAPHDAVVNVLTRQLDPDQARALRLLSWVGPVSVRDAEALVGPPIVAGLLAGDRLATFPFASDELIMVNPPALAHGLNAQMTTQHLREVVAVVQSHFGDDYVARPTSGIDPSVSQNVSGNLLETEDRAWSSSTAALVLERTSAQRAARRAAWGDHPSVEHANRLLASLGAAPRTEEVRAIFDRTTIDGSETHGAVEQFDELRALWSRATGTAVPELSDRSLGPPRRQRLRERLGLIQSTIEAGRCQDALELLDDTEGVDSDLQAQFDAARTDALMFAGEPDQATYWARSRLSAAIDSLDKAAIQTHVGGLSGLLLLTGDYTNAFAPVSLALRLGPPGPFEDVPAERGLSIGAGLQARRGQISTAWVLLRELERYTSPAPHPFDVLPAWARAETHYAEGERAQGDGLLWRAGLAAAERGHIASAMLVWMAHAGTLDDHQLTIVEETYHPRQMPLFQPVLELQRALHSGPSDLVLQLLTRVGRAFGPAQSQALVERLNELRLGEGVPPMNQVEIGHATGRADQLTGRGSGPGTEAGVLTDRERQVALYARNGLSNREIASMLFVSVRTVESHMYRILRKLALSSRSDLSGWDPAVTP
ncbi:LuxR C-terminal-related transcriptional regulator [Cellulosimicrobium sp. NPDC057862]|uniref:helix-turn-helix transcriptional regulator n=1 Tax=Cellulosimicrobium sp. NPDC057862 TaxID=3346266 RepID=UPI0036718F43